ncbi:MAG: YmdB family metallophosphoesterase [Spirochaetales bacterium]|nr:YmdB family metallophosphoesterase [Spirochaetales bacterium]
MSTKVLCIGEIVGKAGIYVVKSRLKKIRTDFGVDFVIANGEGATGGFGIGKNHSIYLHKLGIDVITGGECLYYKRDMVEHIQKASYMLRPANYPPGNPGRGWKITTLHKGDGSEQKIAVISLLGQSGFGRTHLSNPFSYIQVILDKLKEETSHIIVDFHAATTAEKYTMFHHLNGKVSAVVGTHTKALTADAQVLNKGTAVICDTGRTGSIDSVGGFDTETEIQQYLTQIPERSKDGWKGLELQGVVIDIDNSGRAVSIETLRIPCEAPAEPQTV